MHIIPFSGEHLQRIDLQDAQRRFFASFDDAYVQALKGGGPAYTAEADGRVIACGGIMLQWPGRALVWSLLSRHAGRHFVALHRCVSKRLDEANVRRLEAVVDATFEPGHRWVRLLGFEREGLMRGYAPDGRDHVLYARVRYG